MFVNMFNILSLVVILLNGFVFNAYLQCLDFHYKCITSKALFCFSMCQHIFYWTQNIHWIMSCVCKIYVGLCLLLIQSLGSVQSLPLTKAAFIWLWIQLKTVILWNIYKYYEIYKKTIFYIHIFRNVIYSCDANLIFLAFYCHKILQKSF